MLLIPSVAPIYPVWLAIGCRRRLPFASLATAVLLLTLSPRILRNWLVLGWPVWGRDNLGLELYTSNNDCASAAFATMMKSGCHAKTHPNANSEGAAQVRDRGEIAYNHRKLDAALAWIGANPGRFASLGAVRFVLFWFPETGPGLGSILLTAPPDHSRYTPSSTTPRKPSSATATPSSGLASCSRAMPSTPRIAISFPHRSNP